MLSGAASTALAYDGLVSESPEADEWAARFTVVLLLFLGATIVTARQSLSTMAHHGRKQFVRRRR